MLGKIMNESEDHYSVDKYLIPPQIQCHRRRNPMSRQVFKISVPIRTLPSSGCKETSAHPLDKYSKHIPTQSSELPQYFPRFPPNSLKVPKPNSGKTNSLRQRYSRILPQTPLLKPTKSKSKSLSPFAATKNKRKHISATSCERRFMSTLKNL